MVMDHITEKRLQGLGIASAQRLAVLPEIPTVIEQGVDIDTALTARAVAFNLE